VLGKTSPYMQWPNRLHLFATVAMLVLLLLDVRSAGAAPFVVGASTGPAAGSRIDATVTRRVDGKNVTLPAALVPALAPGDIVNVDFTDYRRPPSSVNYHVNVAFVTETARQHWLFEKSGPMDRLFSNRRHSKGRAAATHGRVRFVYGAGRDIGIPIFFIIPEDGKTRGVNGVRDYVGAHPTAFVDMSESTNDAVDQYSYLRDFLSSLGNGSIDPAGARDRVATLAQSVGVSPAAVDSCYVAGGTPADVRNCVQQAVNAVVYQTNFSAPTQAQFLGGIAGAASPATYAPYIASLLTVWRLFVKNGHVEYEYLPTTISLADPSTQKRDQLLMGLKIPTVRPPAAASDVLFFTIGDPKATARAPVVVNSAPASGVCERTGRFSVPVNFDHTSRYVHDTQLSVKPDGGSPYAIPLDPRSLDAPVIDRARLHGSVDGGYDLELDGRFGFNLVRQPERERARVVFPENAAWTIAAQPHHRPIAGASLDMIASSSAVPCLSRAELQIGSAAPMPLATTTLDAQRVEVRAALANVPAGPAVIRFYQDDPRGRGQIESTVNVSIDSAPASVDITSATASLADRFLSLAGSEFETVRGVTLNGATYLKQPGATAVAACFTGPPLAGADLAIGQRLTAQLLTDDGSPGEVFPLTLEPRRPVLGEATISDDSPGIRLSTQAVAVRLASGPLPNGFSVRLRQASAAPANPCDDVRADPAAVTLAPSAVQTRAGNVIALNFRPAVLGDRAFGSLQLQLIDDGTGLGSVWQRVPATFARAPTITRIACPSDRSGLCRLYGSGLAAIEAVQDASGVFVRPIVDCPATEKGVPCVAVPQVEHYVLRLVDGGLIETLPDASIPPGT
jgi:hypothetical protein